MLQVLFGFLPWIIFWIFSGMDNWPAAILGALATSIAIVTWRRLKRHDFKTMEVVSLAYFAVHTLITLGLHNDFLIHYRPAVNALVLAGMAWGSLALKSPFTYEYAKEDWPEEVWSDPLFIRTNQIITAVWGRLPRQHRPGRAEHPLPSVQHPPQCGSGLHPHRSGHPLLQPLS